MTTFCTTTEEMVPVEIGLLVFAIVMATLALVTAFALGVFEYKSTWEHSHHTR